MTVVQETIRRSPETAHAFAEDLPIVARWQATQCLHRGTWANVYTANAIGGVTSSATDGAYVLKLVELDRLTGSEREFAKGRIAREVKISREVSHPHLVPVLASELSDDQAWIVQPHCGSRTLRHYVNFESSLPQILWLLRQTCEALRALHATGWLHGDVCAENVVVSEEGHATLIDLAFARRLRTDECDVYQSPFAGRTIYAAPEVFASAGELTPAADMYSLGVLLFEVLVGAHPFYEYAGEEIIAAKKLLTPPDVRQFEPETPFALASFVHRLLAREPLRRPTAGEAMEQLVASEIEAFLLWR